MINEITMNQRRKNPGFIYLSLKIIVAVAGLSTMLFLTACDKGKKGGAAGPMMFQRPPAPVSVSAAIKQDVPVYIDAIGKNVAREMVSIKPQVSGRITELHFVDGAYVKAGSPLFTIDPRPYQAQLHSAEANLAQAQAALSLANTEFDRVKGLIDTKAISQQDYDTRKNAVETAEAQVKLKQSEVEMARLNLNYCNIHSPIEGRTGHRMVDRGNVVTPDTESLLTIQRMDPIYADFTITEDQLTEVQENMKRGTLKVEVRLPDDEADPREGTLTFLDNAVQEGAGTLQVRATMANEDHRFWPGRFVKVRLVLSTKKDAILIPASAPQMSAKGTFVYVIKNDSTAELRPVALGQRQGDLVVINKGLNSGEQVVVNGQLGVTPGGKVHVTGTEPRNPKLAENTGAKS